MAGTNDTRAGTNIMTRYHRYQTFWPERLVTLNEYHDIKRSGLNV